MATKAFNDDHYKMTFLVLFNVSICPTISKEDTSTKKYVPTKSKILAFFQQTKKHVSPDMFMDLRKEIWDLIPQVLISGLIGS